MDRIYRGLIPVFLSLGLLASSYSHADTPKTWLLLCKGGHNTIEMHSRMYSPAGSTARYTSTSFNLTFSKSNQPASAGLAAGSCAWPDRGFRRDEPAILGKLFQQVWVISKTTIAGDRESTQYTVKGRQDVAAELTALLSALKEGREFQLHVYNDGQDGLVITKVGP